MKFVVRWVKAAVARLVDMCTGGRGTGPGGVTGPVDGSSAGPVEHVGATETFGAELRALRATEVSPELVSDIETELHWGQVWYDFERTMQWKIDETFAPYLPVPEVESFEELREQAGLDDDAPPPADALAPPRDDQRSTAAYARERKTPE